MAAPMPGRRAMRSACDRCYQLKERCVRVSTSGSCTRCSRLNFVCLKARPIRPAGRRPRHRVPTTPDESNSSAIIENIDAETRTWLNNVHDLVPEEKALLLFFLDKPETLESYVVSPIFRAAEQQSLAASLRSWPSILKDAYLAYAGTLKQLQQPSTMTKANQSTTLRLVSSALKTLRSLTVTNSTEAALCLNLGKTLSISVYAAIGYGVADICHHCLSLASPFLDSVLSHADAAPSFLVILETMDCLVHRQVPTLRIPSRGPDTVDRHIGLCLPLLPYYYDLCVISHSLANATDASYLTRIEKRLDDVHAAVESWQPSHCDQLIDQFQSPDVVSLLAQARVFRLAALLVSHRLRCRFGQQDTQADIWSKEIMTELELARRVTKRPMQCVTLPFLVAAIEIRDQSTRVATLQAVEDYVDRFAPLVQRAARSFLSKVWRERDTHLTYHWFDSVFKPCVVLHYADSA